MEIQRESSTSNDVSQKLSRSTEIKEEEEPENKKLKQDELASTQETQNETTINDLPTEMLVKILKHVNAHNLIPCRLVNQQWLQISTEILYSRGEMEIDFKTDYEDMILKTGNRGSLGDFVQCFNQSKNCPYSSFYFEIDLGTLQYHDHWSRFLSDLGERVRCLRLVIEPHYVHAEFVLFLRDVLLNKAPHLKHFGLKFSSNRVDVVVMNLFPSSTLDSPVQLPHLKSIHLSEIVYSNCPGIVDELLKAAVNLNNIKDSTGNDEDSPNSLKTERYSFLHSRGKLDLLENTQITPSVQLFSAFEGKNVPAFKLGNLELCMTTIYKEEENWAEASTFISTLFESCKDTLKQLTMDPVGFLPGVKLPRFTKLEILVVEGPEDSEIFEPVFPSGIHSLDVFPVLRIIDLSTDWTRCFPAEENIPRIPTVEHLGFSDLELFPLTQSCISKMSLMCPNLKKLSLTISYGKETVNFPEVGRAIWTHMKQLQSLDLQINVDSDFNIFHSLDSCFTGISVENCSRLFELLKANEYLKRWNSQLIIPKAEFETPERESVSILDLKDLTSLKVHLHWCVQNCISSEDIFKRTFTSVSQIYAFNLMENLKCKIDQDFKYEEESSD